MSINGPLSGIRFSGVGSGIDVDSIVSQLMQIESFPLQRLQTQQIILQNKQQLYSQFRSSLVSLNAASSSLNAAGTFNPIKAQSSKSEVATLSAAATATAGTYELTVSKLAQSQKLSSIAQTSTSAPLGHTGNFVINGKAINVTATDTLTNIASKINEAGAGVTASLLNGGEGSAYLTLTSTKSGAKGALQMSDLTGTTLSSLGIIGGAPAIRDLVDPTTVRSFGLSSSTESIGNLLGQSASGLFRIGVTDIAVDFANDSLQDIADRVNLAGTGATASVVTATENGKTTHKLQITGPGIPGDLSDPNGLLENIGFYQRPAANQLIAAQDAEFTIDGFAMTSATNTVADVIPGVTVTLLKANSATPETSTLTLTKDFEKIKDSLKDFQKAYNSVVDFIKNNSAFDSETFDSGPLFGDSMASQVESTLADILFTNVGSGTLQNLAQLGFGMDQAGKLTLDEAIVDTTLASNLDGVKNLLMSTGTSTNSLLKYVSSSSKTIDSGQAGYVVDITQVATKTTLFASKEQTMPNAGGELLTFSGSAFGSQSINLYVDAGSSLADLVTKINNDSRLKNEISASIVGGHLNIESIRFGSPGRFTVVSNLAAGPDNSGIGVATESVRTDGLDVAGTINGEAATGSGQFLLGNTGNTTTEGLQVQYTGNTLGVVGNVGFTRGVASLIGYRMDSFTDSVNGLFTSTDKSLSDQISDLSKRIEDFQEQLTLRESTLRRRYAAMESAIAQLQSQSSRLSAMG